MSGLDLIVKSPEVEPEPTMTQVILAELKRIPDQVMEAIPDPLDDHDRITLSVLKTLQVVDRFADLIYTESVAVPVLEHDGPDIQYTHVPCTEEIKGLPDLYWNEVSQ